MVSPLSAVVQAVALSGAAEEQPAGPSYLTAWLRWESKEQYKVREDQGIAKSRLSFSI